MRLDQNFERVNQFFGYELQKMNIWEQQLDFIKEKISNKLWEKGQNFTYENAASLFGVKRGRVANWLKGQRPSSDALQKIGNELQLSANWLLYGEGKPEATSMAIQNIRPNAVPETGPQVCPSCSTNLVGHIVYVHATTGAGSPREHWEPEPLFQVCIPERFYWRNLIVIQVAGTSMEPLIKKGAFVGLDTSQTGVIAGEVYGVRVPYEGVTLKRVFVDPTNDSLQLQSENPKHPEQFLPIEGREDLIVGKAVWVMQEI